MKKSKTKLLVAIIVILIIITIVIAGVYLYLATDLFKSNQQLFLKYLIENGTAIEAFSKKDNTSLLYNINQDKYSENLNINFNVESNDTRIKDAIPVENFSIKSFAKVDSKNNMSYRETSLKYIDKDLFKVEYVRNGDLYALKSDEVINKYLVFENNNLKQFISKFGITDTSMIPDKIEAIDIERLFLITEKQQKDILQKYLPIINAKISSDRYKSEKEKNITVNGKDIVSNAYTLEMTQEEIIEIFTSILDTLKSDDNTLNLIMEKIEILDLNNNITIEELKDVIQNIIDDLGKIQPVNEETIKITVYESKGKLVRTEVAIGNDIIYIDTEKNSTSSHIAISFENTNELQQNADNIIDINQNEFNPLYENYIGLKLKKIELARENR